MNAMIKLTKLPDESIYINVSYIQKMCRVIDSTKITICGQRYPEVIEVMESPLDICRIVREAQAEILRRAK